MTETIPAKSICFFCSYYNSPELPAYVRIYLSELKRHFTEVVLLTNEKIIAPADLQFLASAGIPYRLYENEGFDFGMWYKALQEYDITKYERIGLVNDSCILFKKLDAFFNWLEKENIDYAGMSDSNNIQYHIQSYFLVINKRAIALTKEYFQQYGIIKNLKAVIETYEVGLSIHLYKAGLKLQAYYSLKSLPYPFQNKIGKDGKLKGNFIHFRQWQLYNCYCGTEYIGNPVWYKTKDMIKSDFPLIKKKILIRNYGDADWKEMVRVGFDPDPRHYTRLIKKMYPDWSMDELLKGLDYKRNFSEEVQFYYKLYIQDIRFFISHKIYVVKRAIVILSGKN